MASRPKEKRAYVQSARAEATAASADRMLEAATELITERWLDEVTLDDIAARSGMTVRTLIRRFGSRDGVVMAAVDRFRTRLLTGGSRELPPAGDVRATVRLLVDYYERDGFFLLRGLAQEDRYEFLRENFAGTRERHREWIAAALAPQLELPPRQHSRRLAELSAATWVTTWKFLRLDSGLPRDETEACLEGMVEAIARRDRSPARAR